MFKTMSCFLPNPNLNPSPLKEKIQILIHIQIHKKSLNPAFQIHSKSMLLSGA